jgi:hypothetical protein
MICASVYLLVFIRDLLVHLAEKILLMQPPTFGGDYPFVPIRVHGWRVIRASFRLFGDEV